MSRCKIPVYGWASSREVFAGPCLDFLPEKEGIRLSASTYQPLLCASWHSTPLQVKAPYIVYIYIDSIISRHHKAAGLKYLQ